MSSAYNVAGVGFDAHGNPAKIFVCKTSWDHAVQIVRGDDGVTRAVIDWDWFKEYRDILIARVAAGKKVIPEIYQRYYPPQPDRETAHPSPEHLRQEGGRAGVAEPPA